MKFLLRGVISGEIIALLGCSQQSYKSIIVQFTGQTTLAGLCGSLKMRSSEYLRFGRSALFDGVATMARACDVCGKGPQMGNRVQTRGKAKYLGGVGTKLTGITRRQFKPNLQRVRVTTTNGTNKRMLVCTQCLRSGAIVKRVQAKPFALPAQSE